MSVLGTFPVRPSIFRFPLDLIFCSKGIQVNAIKILSDIGSDHLPLFSKITVSSLYATTEVEMDSDLEEEIDEIIKEGRKEAYKEKFNSFIRVSNGHGNKEMFELNVSNG